jgi:hypothetical protein
MLVSFAAFGLTFAWMLVHRYRLEVLEERYETEGLTSALEARRAEVPLPASGAARSRQVAEAPAEVGSR